MKEAIHLYHRAGVVHFKELKPRGRLRVYHVNIGSMLRLINWLATHEDKILSRMRGAAGETFVIERRDR